MKEHEKGLGARDKTRKEETSIKAAQIEKTGEQIEIAKQRGVTYDHGMKVNQHQQGLLNLEEKLEKEIGHIDNILAHQSKHPQIQEAQKYRNWLERFKGNVRNKFEITHKQYPYNENNTR